MEPSNNLRHWSSSVKGFVSALVGDFSMIETIAGCATQQKFYVDKQAQEDYGGTCNDDLTNNHEVEEE